MLKSKTFWKTAGLVLVVVVLFAMTNAIGNYFWEEEDKFVPPYTPVKEEAKVVKITGQANVRKDPILKEETDFFYYSNSFGLIREENFTFEVSQIFRLKQPLDRNGEYIGLAVEDILATKEGKDWFPESIKDDPDGIVWVNYKYIAVLT